MHTASQHTRRSFTHKTKKKKKKKKKKKETQLVNNEKISQLAAIVVVVVVVVEGFFSNLFDTIVETHRTETKRDR